MASETDKTMERLIASAVPGFVERLASTLAAKAADFIRTYPIAPLSKEEIDKIRREVEGKLSNG